MPTASNAAAKARRIASVSIVVPDFEAMTRTVWSRSVPIASAT